ncbi:TetR/AcrR family transcriptional regulator [Leucobacter japonicus]|uniref:TetR/AcrR family transcriptional regulator n=1 Tax=Leucobacter japonicus TaxID=1461259 RepID=UPI0006A7E29C|nr:TetR/AcrR family transcriptional regulator [Leucobacter japonicus]
MSTTPQEPPTARRRETRSRLLDAAAEVFAEAGVQAASVEQVCARAGFSRGAFYSNFSSKEQLFLALLEREFDRRVVEVEATIAELTPALEQLQGKIDPEQAAEYITRFIAPEQNAPQWFILENEFALMAMRDPEIAPGYIALLDRATESFAALVEVAIAAAGRRFIFPADRTTEIIDGMCDRAIRITVLEGEDHPRGIAALPHQIGELLFAVTEPIG